MNGAIMAFIMSADLVAGKFHSGLLLAPCVADVLPNQSQHIPAQTFTHSIVLTLFPASSAIEPWAHSQNQGTVELSDLKTC